MQFDNLTGKRLLLLGGMQISCEVVRAAKSMGVHVCVTDYFDVENSPAKQMADEHFEVSTIDVDAVVELIKSENIDGVLVAFNDMLLPYYSEICEKSGLPCYGNTELFKIFSNKKLYKERLQKYDIPVIKEYNLGFAQDEVPEDIEYPILIKPADGSGSRGITVCLNREETLEAIARAKSSSKCDEVIVEEFVKGDEATVFWVFQDGEYYLATMGNRHMSKPIKGNSVSPPVGYTFPSIYLDGYIKHTEAKVKRMLNELGVRNGMMFMQGIVRDGVFYTYDIGYRTTGTLEYRLLERICGYNPLKMMIHFALTGKMANESVEKYVNPHLNQYAFNVSCLSNKGRIAKLAGIEEAENIEGVDSLVIAHYPGEEITDNMVGLLSQITVRVLGVAENKDNLFDRIARVNDTIRIVSDEGRDIKIPGLERKDMEKLVADPHK